MAAATDEQICALFYCTGETDNEDYEIENPVVLVWLNSDNRLALALNEMKPLECFSEFHYFEQFKAIIVGADLKPIPDLSAKKDNANTADPVNQEILSIINKLRIRRLRKF